MLSPLVPDLDRLREELLATTPEDKAYYRGKSAAKQAIDILTRAGVLLPPIYGERGTDGVVEGLAAIAEQVGINPKVVYNPGSGLDVAIAEAFPDARAIFLDLQDEVAEDLSRVGLEAYSGNMETFLLPDGIKADLTLILNAGSMTQVSLDKVVAPGGLVVVNEWHRAATFMQNECPSYELLDISGLDLNVHGSALEDGANTLFAFQRTT